MTAPLTVTSLKDVPLSARVYYIGKNLNGEADNAAKAYEKKYGRKANAVIFQQNLYVEHKENGK